MKTRKRITAFLSVMSAALLAFVLSGEIAAQGRYTSQYSRADVDNIIRRMETSADEFQRDFNSELDRSNLSNSQKRIYRNQVSNFENATDRLRSNFDNSNTWWQSRNQVQTVVSNANPLNSTMLSIGFRRQIERQWNQLRNNVNRLADTYDVAGIAGGGWTGGGPGWGGGGSASRPPNWARGTFYSRNIQGYTMSIDANGRVTLNSNGGTSYGTWYNGTIYINSDQYPATRTSYGMRAMNRYTGEATEYARTGGGENDGGNDGGDNSGGPTTNPPNWAQGTFESTNIRGYSMTISSNGRVTINSDGGTSYGRYYNGSVYINNEIYPITQSNNGLRAYDQRNGTYTNYRRRR